MRTAPILSHEQRVTNKQYAMAGHCQAVPPGEAKRRLPAIRREGGQVIEQPPAPLMQRPLTMVMRAMSPRDCCGIALATERGSAADF
jgi:hypothetical protein